MRKRAQEFAEKRLGIEAKWSVQSAIAEIDKNILILRGIRTEKSIGEAEAYINMFKEELSALPELRTLPDMPKIGANEDTLVDRTIGHHLQNMILACEQIVSLEDEDLEWEEKDQKLKDAAASVENFQKTLSVLQQMQKIVMRRTSPVDVMDTEAMFRQINASKASVESDGSGIIPSMAVQGKHARYAAAEYHWLSRILAQMPYDNTLTRRTVVDISFEYRPLAAPDLADALPGVHIISLNVHLPAVVVHVEHEVGDMVPIKPLDAYFGPKGKLLYVSLNGNLGLTKEQIESLVIECKRDLERERVGDTGYHSDFGNSISYAPLERFERPNLEYLQGGFDVPLPLKEGELADIVRVFSSVAIEELQVEGVLKQFAPHIRTDGYLVLSAKNSTEDTTRLLVYKKKSDGKLDYIQVGLVLPSSLSRDLKWGLSDSVFAKYQDLWDQVSRATEKITKNVSASEYRSEIAKALEQQDWVVISEYEGALFLKLNPDGSPRVAYPDKKSLRAGLEKVSSLILEKLPKDGIYILSDVHQRDIKRVLGRHPVHLARSLIKLAQDQKRATYLPTILQLLDKTVDIFGDLGRNLTEEVLVEPLVERPDLWIAAFRELNKHPDLSSHQKKRADTKLERFLRYHVRRGPNCFGQSALQSAWRKNCSGAARAIISMAESYLSGDLLLKRKEIWLDVPGNPLKSVFARKLGKPWLVQLLAEHPNVLGQIWPKLRRYQLTFKWLYEEHMFGANAMQSMFYDDALAATRLVEVIGSVEEKRLRESDGSLASSVLFSEVLPGHHLTMAMLREKAKLAPEELAEFLRVVKSPKSKASLYQLAKPTRLGWAGLSSELLVHGKELIDLLRRTEPSSAFYDEEIGIAGEFLLHSLSARLEKVYQRRMLEGENLKPGWEQTFAREAQGIMKEWAASRFHRFLLEHLLPFLVKPPRPGYIIRKYLVFETESREGNLGFYINVRSPKSSSRIHGNTADISLLMPLKKGAWYDAFAAPKQLTPWDRQVVPLELRTSFSLFPYRADLVTNNPGAYRIRNDSEHLVIELNLFVNRHYFHITDYVPAEGKENEYVESPQWAYMHNMPIHTELIMGARKLSRAEADATYAQVVKGEKAFPILTTHATAIIDSVKARELWEKYRPDVWVRSNGKLLFELPPSAPSSMHHEPHKLAVAA